MMKWCQAHWTQLRQSIEDAGMGHLISQGGEEATKNLKASLEGTATAQQFDPLLSAWSMIDAAFLGPLPPGGAIGIISDPAPICTLCRLAELNDKKPDIVTNWIGGCTKQVRDHCVELGLLK